MNINGYEVREGVLDLAKAPLTNIESKAFWSQRAIRHCIMPASIEHIGDWAFAKCVNLSTVRFSCKHHPGLFGRDVFSGCEELISIEFSDMSKETSRLLALCANKLPFDHLIRSDDIGEKTWYEKWDISLLGVLASDDAAAKMSAVLCGEEDISYDGIGSVDGEMPGETGDFVRKEEFKKCSLCYTRLLNDTYLSDDTRSAIEGYIRDNAFGNSAGSAYYSIFEEEDVLLALRVYLDVVAPDRETMGRMIADTPQKEVLAISYLIKESGSLGDAVTDLLL